MSENLVQYVEAAGRGDTDAMAKLYSKTLKSAFFLASKLSESESEAIEITKKAYARVFCSFDKLKKPEAFEIWLKQMVSSVYKDSAKFVFSDADGSAQESVYDFLPESVLEDEKAAAKIMEAISNLTPERRTAVVLHYYLGMPKDALAKYFGVSVSTATAILSNAKADINSKSGIKAPDYPELASLPVLTRLFKILVEKLGIENSAVREIFVFAIEAYLEVTPKTLEEPIKDEADPKEEPPCADAPEAEEEAAEEAEESEEAEAAEEPEEAAEADDEPEEAVEAADEAEVQTNENAEAEIEDGIISLKNEINSMLSGVEEIKADEPVEAAGAAEDPFEIKFTQPAANNDEVTPIEDDTFEKIKISIDSLAEMQEGEQAPETQNDGAVAFADFAGSEVFMKEEPAAIEPQVQQVKPANKKSKKSRKANPKIIIAAIAILAVIVVAVVLIVKSNKDNNDDKPETTASATVAHSNEEVRWVALPELADYEEIEYLNENFNSFKDPDTGKYGLINYKGEVVLEAEYDGFRRCSNGKYYGNGVLADSDYHIVAEKGDSEYEVVMIGSTASVGNLEHTDHSTSNNTTMDGTDYDERDRYYEGYAAVRKDGKWGYVSSGGKIVVPYEFEAVNDIPSDDPAAAFDYCRGSVNGYVAVKKDGKMGIIKIEKETYEIVVDYEYDMICQGKGGVFLAYNGSEWGNIVIGSASTEDIGQEEITETTTLTPVTEPTEPSIGRYRINADATNIRTSPNTNNTGTNIITALDEGYEITGLEIKKGSNGSDWVRFEYKGQEAWVSSKKLDKIS